MKQSPCLAFGLLLGASALLPSSGCASGEASSIGVNPSGGAPGTPGGVAGAAGSTVAIGAAGNGPGSAGRPSVGGASSAGAPGAGGSMSSAGAAGAPCSDLPPNNGDTCAHAVEYGWCGQSWLGESCRQTCGKCSTGAGGSTGLGGATGSAGSSAGATGSAGHSPVLEGGTNGWASRYWDCCKPACGWRSNVPGGTNPVSSCNISNQSLGGDYDQASACPNGNNGGAFMCQNFGPWAVSNTLAYGFAAVNKGGDYCGRCYELLFTGTSHNATTDAGSASIAGKTMIVQAINTGGVDGNQFDLLIPGGGVGDFNACATQWGTSSLGEQYGGFLLACQKQNAFDYSKSKACAAAKCQSVFANKPDLLASCNWFTTWFGAPDNPSLMYKEVACPAAITSLSGLHR